MLRTRWVFLSLLLWCLHWQTIAAAPAIHARAAILADASTGQILYEKNAGRQLAPASTTKIMTAILAIESNRLDETVTISARAAATPGSSLHLTAGQTLTLRELVAGLMLRSGNDAAVAIAEHLAGTTEAFVALMNQKAAAVGAYHTHFCNPHGLPAPGHYSTAFDLAWLARYAMENPAFAAIVNTRQTRIDWLDRRGRAHAQDLKNTNKLLWMLPEADGVKTGTTGEAGPCLVSSATKGNQRLIAVVLHDTARWQDSLRLLEWGFDHYDLYEYAMAGDVLETLPVENGLDAAVDAVAAARAALVVETAQTPSVAVTVELPAKIKAPVYQGQKIGEIVFHVRQDAVKTVNIIAARTIEERTPARLMLNQLLHWFRLFAAWGFF